MQKLEERIRQYEPFFGEWTLGKEIESLGHGSFGTVFTIRKGPLVAALKVISIPPNEGYLNDLRLQKLSEEEIRKHIIRDYQYARKEIETMKDLNGTSNVVYFEQSRIYERTDTFGWDVLIRMEKLVRLDEYLRTISSKNNTQLILHIWDDLLEGLKACQKQGIVHLDIKPDNIFYSPATDYFKLGDFGEAHKQSHGELVIVGGQAGTREYMSPEIYHGRGGDARSDIYSLALTIYQLLNNNRLPFVESSGVITKDDLIHANEIRWSNTREIPKIKGLDSNVMMMLQRCLDYFPDRRFYSAAETQDILRRIVYSGSTLGGKSKNLGLIIAFVLIGFAGVLVFLGIVSSSGKKNQPQLTQAPVVETTFIPEEQYLAQDTSYPTIPPITEAPTESPTEEPTEEPTEAPTEEPTEEPTEVPIEESTEEPTEAPTEEPTEEPTAVPVAELRNFRIEVNREELTGNEAVLDGDACQIRWYVDGATEGFYVYLYDERGNTIEQIENTNNIGLDLITASLTQGENYRLRVGAMPMFGSEEDIIWKEITLICPKPTATPTEAPTPTPEPTEAPTEVPTEAPTEVLAPEPTIVPFKVDRNEAAERGYINKEGYIFINGSAEPGRSVYVYLDGEKIKQFEVGESGKWSMVLGKGHFQKDNRESYQEPREYEISFADEYEISFAYRDGEIQDTIHIIYDAEVETLDIEGPLRLDDRYVRGKTEPGAEVTVFWGVHQIGSPATADDEGFFEVDLGASFAEHGQIVNDSINVTAQDAVGHIRKQYLPLQYKEVLPLQIEIPAASANGNVPVSDEFVMILTGEPMEECTIKRTGERNGVYSESEYTVILNEKGMFTEIVELWPGKYNISAEYLNTKEFVAEVDITIDKDSRLISLDGEFVAGERDAGKPKASPEIPSGMHKLSGRTRPNARVCITGNGVFAEAQAESGGQFVLPEIAFERDKEYIIIVEDAHGNRMGSMAIYAIEVEYAPLSAEIPMMIDNIALIDSGDLLVNLKGEPNTEVTAVILNDGSEPLFNTVTLDENGEAQLREGLPDGNYILQIYYADRQDSLQNYTFTIDRSAKFVEAESEFFEGTRALSGKALPGATVYLEYTQKKSQAFNPVYTQDGSRVSAVAEPDGSFVLPEVEYSSAWSYRLYVAFVVKDKKQFDTMPLKVEALQPITLVSLEDPAVLNEKTASLTLGITAMENSQINIYINDELADAVTADGEGNSWYIVKKEQLLPDQDNKIYAKYSSTPGGRRSDTIKAYYDSGCELGIRPVFENTKELEIVTDPGAYVEILANGQVLMTGYADAEGKYIGRLDKTLAAGTELTIAVLDDYKNGNSLTIRVEMLDRANITAQILPSKENGVLNRSDLNQITVSGEAEANVGLRGRAFVDDELAIEADFATDANGHYEWADIHVQALDDAKNLRVEVCYGDGYASQMVGIASAELDLTGPEIQLNYDMIDADTDKITGAVSESAVVHLYSEMARIDETLEVSAGETFSFEYLVLSEGDQLTLNAKDAYGNTTIKELTVSAPIMSIAGYIKMDKDSYIAGEEVKMEGWILCHEDDEGIIGLQLTAEKGSLGLVTLTGKTPMSDAEFQQKLSEISEPTKANKGFWISQSIKLGESALVGNEFWPSIVVQHQYEDWVYIHNADTKARVESASGTAAAIRNFINDTSAMGFDLEQNASFPADKVMLTGWFYGRDYSIHKVVFWPASNPNEKSTIWIDSVDIGTISASGNMVCYLPRKAMEACPSEYQQKLVDVVPDDSIAGFMLNLNLQENEDVRRIENGEYVITLHAATDGPVEETASISIIVDNTVSVDANLVEKVSQEWNPIAPEEMSAQESIG